jgi:hypothetical protein
VGIARLEKILNGQETDQDHDEEEYEDYDEDAGSVPDEDGDDPEELFSD